MPYTSIDLIRNHISFEGAPGGTQRNYPIIFSGTQWISLPYRGLLSGSVAVKAAGSIQPSFENIILGNEPIALAARQIAAESVTIASDRSLGTIYAENTDYAVDPINAAVRRIPGGNISEGASVAVWYIPYIIYEEGTDYSVNYTEGMIRRLAGGAIQDYQAVLIDYEISVGAIDDVIISQAISEADAVVERDIDSGQSFGADPTLQTAATYLTVSLLCRMAASGHLVQSTLAKNAQNASSWLALAESYRGDYDRLIKPYRPQATRLSGPTRT